MRVIYNEFEDQLLTRKGHVIISGILTYGEYYTVLREGEYFYSIDFYNEEIICGKSHFITERELRKLKLDKIGKV